MCRAIAQFSCFAILTVTVFAKCSPNDLVQDKRARHSGALRDAKDEILAGEDTPVWLARRHYPHNTIVYDRLTDIRKQQSIVKQSMNHWNLIKANDGFRVRKKPKIDEKNFLTSGKTNLSFPVISPLNRFKARRDIGNDGSVFSNRIKKKNIVEDEVLYPSVLVVMDYQDVHPIADKAVRWLSKEKVIYALAFWETVARSLRKIRNPRVSLRIAGIVLSTTRQASPYLQENRGIKTLKNALPKMLNYWAKVAKINRDFQPGSHDIIAHMTDIYPRATCTKCAAPHQKKNPLFVVASKGPPCNLRNKIAGLIIHDDFAFKGLWSAISRMPKILGSSASPTNYNRRKWDKEALDHISTALKNASCMSRPKGRYGPGKPVDPILAGELLPGVKQCEADGYGKDAWTCWHRNTSHHRSNCQYLACSTRHNRHDHCSEVGRILDGTFCDANNKMICLDGNCVKEE